MAGWLLPASPVLLTSVTVRGCRMLPCGHPGMAGVAALTGHLGRAAIGSAAFICFYLALSGWWPGGFPLRYLVPSGGDSRRPAEAIGGKG